MAFSQTGKASSAPASRSKTARLPVAIPTASDPTAPKNGRPVSFPGGFPSRSARGETGGLSNCPRASVGPGGTSSHKRSEDAACCWLILLQHLRTQALGSASILVNQRIKQPNEAVRPFCVPEPFGVLQPRFVPYVNLRQQCSASKSEFAATQRFQRRWPFRCLFSGCIWVCPKRNPKKGIPSKKQQTHRRVINYTLHLPCPSHKQLK